MGSTGALVGFLVGFGVGFLVGLRVGLEEGFGVTGESDGIGVVHTSIKSQLAKLPKTERQHAFKLS
jgi:hypothetical protein